MIKCDRFVHTLYCDDVRQELGGKLSFIGVYRGDLTIQQQMGPIVLPKMCVVVTAQTPAERPFRRLNFRLIIDQAQLMAQEVQPEELEKVQALQKASNSAYHVFSTVFQIQPFSIPSNCTLRVRVDTEDGELAPSALPIKFEGSSPVA